MIRVWYWFRRQVEQTPQTQDMSELEEEIYSTEQFNSQSTGVDDDFIESKSVINNLCHLFTASRLRYCSRSFPIHRKFSGKWSSCTTHHACGVVAPRLIPRQVQRLHQRRFGCSRPGMFNCMQLYKQLYIPRWFPNGRWWALYLSPNLLTKFQVSTTPVSRWYLLKTTFKNILSFQSSFPNENYQVGLAKVDGRLW